MSALAGLNPPQAREPGLDPQPGLDRRRIAAWYAVFAGYAALLAVFSRHADQSWGIWASGGHLLAAITAVSYRRSRGRDAALLIGAAGALAAPLTRGNHRPAGAGAVLRSPGVPGCGAGRDGCRPAGRWAPLAGEPAPDPAITIDGDGPGDRDRVCHENHRMAGPAGDRGDDRCTGRQAGGMAFRCHIGGHRSCRHRGGRPGGPRQALGLPAQHRPVSARPDPAPHAGRPTTAPSPGTLPPASASCSSSRPPPGGDISPTLSACSAGWASPGATPSPGWPPPWPR